MPNPFTKTTFSTTYKDDFRDSDHYHRILFNSGRALQARELTQLQTITQKEIERLGRHIFKEGSVVLPGGLTLDTNFSFVKLATTDTTGFAVGDQITGGTSGVIAKILRIEQFEDTDNPATFYVKYLSTQSGTAGASTVRFSPSESLSNGSVSINVQATNTTANPAVGLGSRAAVEGGGTFFVLGHFVTTDKEEIILDRYSSTPNKTIGFKVTEDVVTVDDTDALYDNQQVNPNLTAPGADRYRIRLNLTTQDKLNAEDAFITYNVAVDGVLQREVDETTYNIVERELATRISEESGDYVVEGFTSSQSKGDSDSVLRLDIQRGIAYVKGYRVANEKPNKIIVEKPRSTETVQNEAIAANYGNYVLVTAPSGAGFIPNMHVFQRVSLRPSTGFSGTTRGTARVRSLTEDGANYRLYLWDVQMDAGYKFSDMRSIGLGANQYFDLVLEGGVAVIKEAVNNNLFFSLGKERPQSVEDVSFTVQRRFVGTTTGGTLDLSGDLGVNESFTNQTQWIVAIDSSTDEILPDATVSGSVVTTNTGRAADDIEVLAYVNLSAPTVRTKTLTETTTTSLDVQTQDGQQMVKLPNPDIVSIQSLVDSDGAGNERSVLDRFIFDNGQRDNFYMNGRLLLRGGATAPATKLKAVYRHYVHGTGDYFSVNSYSHLSGGEPRQTTTVGAGGGTRYAEIPKHRQRNGETVELRNVLDFRPYIESNGDAISTVSVANLNELPQNTDTITADVIYYQGRNDILVIDQNKTISYIQGVPALDNRITPRPPQTALKIKEYRLNPFTDNELDVEEYFVENRNYTMRDISDIVERIENLEEVTTLNLLETQTESIEVLDSNGVNRFKNGLFADNFVTMAYSNVNDSAYTATFDLGTGRLNSDVAIKSVPLGYDSADAANTGTALSENFVHLDYTEDSFITQTLATETENINPFEVITFVGSLRLEPETDIFTVTRRVGGGVTRVRLNRFEFFERFRGGRQNTPDRPRAGSAGLTLVETTQTTRTTVSIRLLPFIRSRLVRFKAEGLRPLTQHFLFFDGEHISSYAKEETFFTAFSRRLQDQYINSRATTHPDPVGTTPLISDASGEIIGSFLVPNNDSLRFERGEREVKLLDISVNNDAASQSSAFASYFGEGTVRTIRVEGTVFITTIPPLGRDPLAQSFVIAQDTGAFLTGIDVYFSSKPTGVDANIPVKLEVRPLRNGVPSQNEIFTGSSVTVPATSVNLPADSDDLASILAAPTRFAFPSPVYIPGGTNVAFVLMADTLDYNVYVAKAGDLVIGTTTQRVRQQPSLGSLFLSQNAITWTPDQTRDMMFKVHRAKFVSSGTAVLENIDYPDQILEPSPFLTASGDSSVTVFSRGHGLGVGDKVTLTGVDSTGDFGGITGTSLQGERTVVKVDGTGFTFQADSAATSSVLVGNADGSEITFTDNIQMDTLFPTIESFIPVPEARITYNGSFAEGRSFSSPTNTYAISGSRAINPFEPIDFESPKVIAHRAIENTEATLLAAGDPRRSLKIVANLTTTSDFVSPVILMSRTGIIAENNLIDNQDSDASVVSPLNNPLTWVDETDPQSGSHLSKHITRPISLEQPAVGLKVLIGANRPDNANFDLYYRTISAGEDININDVSYVLASQETIVQTDEDRNVYRDYEYTIGGLGGDLVPFTTFQLKIVMRSSNSSKVPTFRDLRAIALGT